MPFVAIVTVLALLQFLWLGLQVASARTKYGVAAPATTGHAVFERHFRVQMNTLEQLLMFLPALWLFATYISPLWAAALGVVFILGRAIYAISYVRDPKTRALGFALTAFPTLAMLIGIVVWAVRAILLGAAW
ncbi:MAG TPA: MAPEG family protein [Steroidobacter sp.]|nr:MAPEG family protein [Steroidobacter sp.]